MRTTRRTSRGKSTNGEEAGSSATKSIDASSSGVCGKCAETSMESDQNVVGAGLPSALKQSGSEKKKAKKESVQFDISDELPTKPKPKRKRKRKEKGNKDTDKSKMKKTSKHERKTKSEATAINEQQDKKKEKKEKKIKTKEVKAKKEKTKENNDKKNKKDKDKKSDKMDITDEKHHDKTKIADKRKKKRKRNKDKRKDKASKRLRIYAGMGLIEACLVFRRKSNKNNETSLSSPTSTSEQLKARLPEPHELDQYNYRHYQSRPLDYKITVPMPPMWKVKCIAELKKREYLKNKAKKDVAKSTSTSQEGIDHTTSVMQKSVQSSSDTVEKEEKMDIASESNLTNKDSVTQGKSVAQVDKIPLRADSSGNKAVGEIVNSSNDNSKSKVGKNKDKGSIRDKDTKYKKSKKVKKKLPRKLLSKSPLSFPLMGLQVANKPLLAQYSDQDLLTELEEMNRNCTILKTEMLALEGFRNNVVWLMDRATMLQTQRNHNIDEFDASFPVVSQSAANSRNSNSSINGNGDGNK
jgi:hypothetical protein